MNQDQKVQQAVQRLLIITWEYDTDRLNSYLALMKEYLRRSALWIDALRLDPSEMSPFFDVAKEITSSRDSFDILPDEVSQHPFLGRLVRRICVYYLRWVTIADQPEILAFQLPAPYEPLIRLFERGGSFRTEHNLFIDFIGAAIPLHDWYVAAKRTVPLLLDDASLNTLDTGGLGMST